MKSRPRPGLKSAPAVPQPALSPRKSISTSDGLNPTKPTQSKGEQAQAPLDSDARFAALRNFLTSQLSAEAGLTNPLMSPSGNLNYDSPSSLARIMSMYTGAGSYGKKASNSKPTIMREALTAAEGLKVLPRPQKISEKSKNEPQSEYPNEDEATIARLRKVSWNETTSSAQRDWQAQFSTTFSSTPTRFQDSLLPVPTLLRTKRSIRCKPCRHILVKPESKVQSTKYKIKLVAINHVPRMSLKAMPTQPTPDARGSSINPTASSIFSTELAPLKPHQFLLTLTNPLFDPLKVTLATPSLTPGRFQHRVTILCPAFEIGANTDVWDEALGNEVGNAGKLRRENNKPNDPSSRGRGDASGSDDRGGSGQAEAGKIWEKGRNWTTVVLEVKCHPINTKILSKPKAHQVRRGDSMDDEEEEDEEEELGEDEDVLEIPIFVRLEWDADIVPELSGVRAGTQRDKKGESVVVKDRRELAYWCVLGVGKIAKGP
ncbi:hypothetical protein MMC25_000952 [Agyrium rufum]|nr:hypothetical protein [Agyrium rufum]